MHLVDSAWTRLCYKRSQFFNIICIIILLVVSLAPLVWAFFYLGFKYIGGADYQPIVDPLFDIYSSLYPFNHINAAGVDQAFLIAETPHRFFYYLLKSLGASSLVAAMALICVLIFTAQFSFYIFVKRISERITVSWPHNNISYLVTAILYGYSPFVIALIIPGHIMAIYIYSVFPLVIYCLDSILEDELLNYGLITLLFLLFFWCAPGFANIGIIYVLILACFIYAFSKTLVNNLPIFRSLKRFSFFVALIFFANAWWLAPHLSNFDRYVALSQTTATSMVMLVAYASRYASVANFFEGRPEGLLYMTDVVGNDYYTNPIISTIFLLISFLVIVALFQHKRKILVLAIAALFSIMFAKGVQPPFSDIFIWAYEHLPGFQILRRPVAKFYGFFIFFFISASAFGLTVLLKKYSGNKSKYMTIVGVSVGAVCYLIFSFLQTPSLAPFNIPNMYYQANKYLIDDRVERAFILPGRYGLNPVYRKNINYYTGQDFVNEIFRFPTVEPDSTTNSLNEPYKKQANLMVQSIRANSSICDQSKILGISHIIVRDDLAKSLLEDAPQTIINALDKNTDLVSKVVFGEIDSQLVVYKVNPLCRTSLLSLNGEYDSFKYDVINPSKIVMDIVGLQGRAELVLLENYSKNWYLFVDNKVLNSSQIEQGLSISQAYNNPSSWKTSLGDMMYLLKRESFDFAHKLSSDYANSWMLDSKTFMSSSVGDSFAKTNSENLRLVLFYKGQAYMYFGCFLSIAALLILLILWIFSKLKDVSKFRNFEVVNDKKNSH